MELKQPTDRTTCRRLLIHIVLVMVSLSAFGQKKATFWVEFTNKGTNPETFKNAHLYLSERSIARRIKNNVAADYTDLPVFKPYVDSLTNLGIHVLYTSRWMNGASIISNGITVAQIKQLGFVRTIEQTRDVIHKKSAHDTNKLNETTEAIDKQSNTSNYGQSFSQLDMANGYYLHEHGYLGNNITIAVIDAGFLNADTYHSLANVFRENRIIAKKDFVNPNENILQTHFHGSSVLSSMGGYLEDTLIGTAPKASFILLRTEDAESEFPLEEDNWVAAAEYADSAGADIINTSLGYTTFENPYYDHSYAQLNGTSSRISRAASMAASKGIMVHVSAGNDGNKDWQYIGMPADAANILAVGALAKDSSRAPFSSFGPASDNRIKPDIANMGYKIVAETAPGEFSFISGTSFSSPITAGLTACLMEAFPLAGVKELMYAIVTSSNQYQNPDASLGYGIPDYKKAFLFLQSIYQQKQQTVRLFPNPFADFVNITTDFSNTGLLRIRCYNMLGVNVFNIERSGRFIEIRDALQSLPSGCYTFIIASPTTSVTKMAIHIREK